MRRYCKCRTLPVRLSRLSECLMKVPATEMAYQDIFYNITAKKCFFSIMQETRGNEIALVSGWCLGYQNSTASWFWPHMLPVYVSWKKNKLKINSNGDINNSCWNNVTLSRKTFNSYFCFEKNETKLFEKEYELVHIVCKLSALS